MSKGTEAELDAFRVDVHLEVKVQLSGHPVPKVDHLPELPCRIDMKDREGQVGRVEGLPRFPTMTRPVVSGKENLITVGRV
jgi:hypothetical protein